MSTAFEWDRPDRRRDARERSARAPIELCVDMEGGDASSAGVTRNISQGGAFVATGRPSSIGERVTLLLTVPGYTVPLPVDAEVRWLRPIADAGGRPAGIGVSFVSPPYGVSLCIAWLLDRAG